LSLEEKLIEELNKSYFFSPRLVGIKRVRTLLSEWADEYTEDKRLRHLFSRTTRSVNMPYPKYFAIMMGSLGWWTSDALYKAEIEGYKEKIEGVRAEFLTKLADPFFLTRFKEVANAAGADPKELLESIKFLLPARKIRLEEVNDSQIEEIVESYKRDIDGRVLRIIKQIRVLLTSGVMGRKQRIETLIKAFAILQSLNIAKFRSDLIADLSKAFGAIEVLDRKNFPKDLDKHITNGTLPKSIKTEILELAKASQDSECWRLK